MSPTLKELTAKEVAANQKQLQTSVSQLDAQINNLNHRWDSLQKFVKTWWPVAATVFAVIVGLISFGMWWAANVQTKADLEKVKRELNIRIDSLKRVK